MISCINNKNTRNILGGLSTDSKPTDQANCSVFVEMDTGKVYMFDKASGKWLEQHNIICAI